METSHFVFFTLVILNISSIALSLRCQKCGPDGEPCSDDANVTSVDCDGFADRCMTVSLTTGLNTMVMKNCGHSTMICQEQGLGYPCKGDLIGGSCNIECCEGDLCNQASPGEVNTTAYNSTKPEVPDSWLKCETCGTDGESCDESNVTSVQCEGWADRCITISMTTGSNTTIIKKCAHSMLNCQEQSQYSTCKQVDSLVDSCTMECCEGDLCNQASPGGVNTTAIINSTESEGAALSLRCQKCGPDGEPCSDDANVTSVDCDGFADRCMTIITTTMITPNAEPQTMVMKDCSRQIICQSLDYQCKRALIPDGGSCNIECCEGDLCNQASPGEVNTTAYNSTKPEVPDSWLNCEMCGTDGESCDGSNVTIVQCGGFADRCMTISMKIGSNTMIMKNCAHSTLNCQEQSQYNPCKQVDSLVGSCNMECCEGNLCNQAAPGKVNTTASNSTKPEVAGRFFKVNSSPVCFGSKNNEYGRFSVPSNGDLAAIKLVHLYGYVACYSGAKWSIWGCGGPRVNVVITTSANDVILPPAEFSDAGYWAIIPGYTPLSPELVLSVFSSPRPVTSGEEFHLWYGEDFIDDREGDNRGTVCSDVYVLLF